MVGELWGKHELRRLRLEVPDVLEAVHFEGHVGSRLAVGHRCYRSIRNERASRREQTSYDVRAASGQFIDAEREPSKATILRPEPTGRASGHRLDTIVGCSGHV
jgi:hypothetical protein